MAKKLEYLSGEQVLNVLAVAAKQSARNHALILLAYRHGLRASEVTTLTLAEVADGHLDVQRLKGSRHTRQPLLTSPNPLLDEPTVLAKWLRERGDADGSQLLFVSRQGSGLTRQQFANVFGDAAAEAGIPANGRHPHILKHSVCSHLIRNGVPVEKVQVFAGHVDLKSTAVYLNISDAEASEAAATAFANVFEVSATRRAA